MNAISTTTKGLSILVRLNSDRLLGLLTVAAALLVGAWLSSQGLR